VVVPPIEELFYRSFLYRYLVKVDFRSVSLGLFNIPAFVITSVLFGFAHGEWLAGILCGFAYQDWCVGKAGWGMRLRRMRLRISCWASGLSGKAHGSFGEQHAALVFAMRMFILVLTQAACATPIKLPCAFQTIQMPTGKFVIACAVIASPSPAFPTHQSLISKTAKNSGEPFAMCDPNKNRGNYECGYMKRPKDTLLKSTFTK